MARKNTNNKESYPLDRIRDEDLSEFHRWTVDLKEVRKMFPGYDIFTQLEAHIFLERGQTSITRMEIASNTGTIALKK